MSHQGSAPSDMAAGDSLAQVDQVSAMPMGQGWPQVGNEKLGQTLAVIGEGSVCQLAEEPGR